MSEAFDPYYKWLGIPAQEQPPNHYRLLTIRLFEEDPQVIEAAADRQMVYLRTFQTGQHVRHAQKLLNEIAQARVCLLNPSRKAEYDAALRRQLAAAEPPPAAPPPVPAALPLEAAPAAAPENLTSPIVVVDPSAGGSVVRRAKSPWWWQPAMVCVGGSAVLLIGVLAVWMLSGTKPNAVTIAPPSAQEKIETPQINSSSHAERPSTATESAPAETTAPSTGPVESASQPATPATPPETPASNASPQTPPRTIVRPTPVLPGSMGVRIDLLRQIDLTRNRVSGNLLRDATSLTSEPNEMAVVQLPFRPNNQEYALEIVAELVDKSGPLNVGLVAGQTNFLLSLDYSGNTVLSNVDGGHYTVPSATPASAAIFAGGARPNIRISVRNRGLEVLSDGQRLVDWKEYGRLSANPSWVGPDRGALTLGWNLGTFKVHKLELIPLVGRFPSTPRSSSVATTSANPSSASPSAATLADLAKKRPVPAKEEVAAAQQQVRSTFQKEFEKATKPDAKAELAKTLAGQAEQARPKPAEHYSMLKLALDLAAEVGEAEAALAALSTLTASYEIDLATVAAPALTELGRSAKTTEARARTVEETLEYVETAAENDNFEVAVQLANLAMSIASKLRDTELRKTAKEQQDEVKLLQKHWQADQAAAATLKEHPNDPAAHLVRGKYLCLVKEEWERGLPFLAKSGDAALKAAAERELATVKKPEDKSALGDAWLAAAKTAPAPERGALEARAEHWYKDALDEVTSLAKTHVEKRLNELKSSGATKTAATTRSKKNQGPVPGMAGRVIMDNGDTGLTVFYQPGAQLKDETLKGVLSRHNMKWRPLQVDLGGFFTVPVSGFVYFQQSCRGPVDAGCRLLVDNQEVSTVGPSDPSSAHGRQLGAGVHSIRWIVAGREAIGACELRVFTSSSSGIENLSVFHAPQNLPSPRRTKAEENLSSN